ncbi:MAG: HD domain-containing protein, partial [bacterium]
MLKRFLRRVRQFRVSRLARYTSQDETFARSYLNMKEWSFFTRLPNFEKKHCVMVGEQMLEAARQHPDLEERKLVRLGLLHDIGKVLENNSIWTKAMLVLIRFFLPPLYDYLADIGQNKPLLRRFY